MGELFSSMREVLKGNVLILTLGTVIRQLSLFVTFPFFSLYVRTLGGSMVDIGIVNAVRPLAAMFIYPIAGALTDKYSRVKVLVAANLLSVVLYLIYTLASDWRYLAVANFVNGLLVFRFPASSALLADSMDSRLRGRGFAAITVIPGFVGILSPFIGGYLMEVFEVELGMRILYGITVIGMLMITFLNWRYLDETLATSSESTTDIVDIIRGSYRDIWETLKWMPRELRFYAVMCVLTMVLNSFVGPYWIIYSKDIHGVSEFGWGTILTITNLVQMLLTIPAGTLIDKHDKRKIVAFALALSSIPTLAFPYVRGYYPILAVLTVISVANAFLMPVAGAIMADMVPSERRGMAMAAIGRGMLVTDLRGGGGGGPSMGFVMTIPVIIGSLLGGYVFQMSPVTPWIIQGCSLFLNAIIATFLLKLPKRD
jgi:MFS family permease